MTADLSASSGPSAPGVSELAEVLGVERACEVMHDAYEQAAVGAGWETQQSSRKPWADVPEANKATMRAAVTALIDHIAASGVVVPAAEVRAAIACPHGPGGRHYYAADATCQRCEMPSWIEALIGTTLAGLAGEGR